MTDRVRYLIVELDRDMRTDDVQCVIDAIEMVKYVRKAELGDPLSANKLIERSVVRSQIINELIELVKRS